MKVTFGRKFWGCMVGLQLLTGVLVFLTYQYPIAITAKVVIVYMLLMTALIITYIGGNVLTKWIGAIKDIKKGIL